MSAADRISLVERLLAEDRMAHEIEDRKPVPLLPLPALTQREMDAMDDVAEWSAT